MLLPKRLIDKPFRNVLPLSYDSKFFWDTIKNADYNNDDYKFVSWKDFDNALDADQILHNKLISLNNHYSDKMIFDDNFDLYNLIPLEQNRNKNRIYDNFHYKTDGINYHDNNSDDDKHLNNI